MPITIFFFFLHVGRRLYPSWAYPTVAASSGTVASHLRALACSLLRAITPHLSAVACSSLSAPLSSRSAPLSSPFSAFSPPASLLRLAPHGPLACCPIVARLPRAAAPLSPLRTPHQLILLCPTQCLPCSSLRLALLLYLDLSLAPCSSPLAATSAFLLGLSPVALAASVFSFSHATAFLLPAPLSNLPLRCYLLPLALLSILAATCLLALASAAARLSASSPYCLLFAPLLPLLLPLYLFFFSSPSLLYCSPRPVCPFLHATPLLAHSSAPCQATPCIPSATFQQTQV